MGRVYSEFDVSKFWIRIETESSLRFLINLFFSVQIIWGLQESWTYFSDPDGMEK